MPFNKKLLLLNSHIPKNPNTTRLMLKLLRVEIIIIPTDLIHRIGIAAPAEKIYRAITTEEGIRAWWTTAAK